MLRDLAPLPLQAHHTGSRWNDNPRNAGEASLTQGEAPSQHGSQHGSRQLLVSMHVLIQLDLQQRSGSMPFRMQTSWPANICSNTTNACNRSCCCCCCWSLNSARSNVSRRQDRVLQHLPPPCVPTRAVLGGKAVGHAPCAPVAACPDATRAEDAVDVPAAPLLSSGPARATRCVDASCALLPSGRLHCPRNPPRPWCRDWSVAVLALRALLHLFLLMLLLLTGAFPGSAVGGKPLPASTALLQQVAVEAPARCCLQQA